MRHTVYISGNLPDGASFKTVGNPDGSVQILGIHTSCQAIVSVISHVNHLINILELQNRLHWTKDLRKQCVLHL